MALQITLARSFASPSEVASFPRSSSTTTMSCTFVNPQLKRSSFR